MKGPICKKKVSSKNYSKFNSGLVVKTRDYFLPNLLAELDNLKNKRD